MNIIQEILALKQSHYYCDDSWYQCPAHPDGSAKDNDGTCEYGAEEQHAKVDAIVAVLSRHIDVLLLLQTCLKIENHDTSASGVVGQVIKDITE